MRMIRSGLLVLAAVALAAAPVFSLSVAPPSALTWRAPDASPAPAPGGPSSLLWLPALAGAIRVKDTATIAKKFVRNASAAAGDYKIGVEAAGADWESNARAGEGNYEAGVQQSIADKRFSKGIAAAGQQKYVQRASSLGAQRFPTGVGAAEGEFAKGAQPYLDALKGMDLPPRRPKGDPGNQLRAQAVAARLRAIKLGK
jgi:hypothetical protein